MNNINFDSYRDVNLNKLIDRLDIQNKQVILLKDIDPIFKICDILWNRLRKEFIIIDSKGNKTYFNSLMYILQVDYENFNANFIIDHIDDINKIVKININMYDYDNIKYYYKIYNKVNKIDYIIIDTHDNKFYFNLDQYLKIMSLKNINPQFLIDEIKNDIIYIKNNLLLKYNILGKIWFTYGINYKLSILIEDEDNYDSDCSIDEMDEQLYNFNVQEYLDNCQSNDIIWDLIINQVKEKCIYLNENITNLSRDYFNIIWNNYGKEFKIIMNNNVYNFDLKSYLKYSNNIKAEYIIDRYENDIYIIDSPLEDYELYLNDLWDNYGIDVIFQNIRDDIKHQFNLGEYLNRKFVKFETIFESDYVLKKNLGKVSPYINKLREIFDLGIVTIHDPTTKEDYTFNVQEYLDNTMIDDININYIVDRNNLQNINREYYVLYNGIDRIPESVLHKIRSRLGNNGISLYNPTLDIIYHPDLSNYFREQKHICIKRSEILPNYLKWLQSMCDIYWSMNISNHVKFIDEEGYGIGVTRDFFTNLGIQIINDIFHLVNDDQMDNKVCSINQLKPKYPCYFDRSIENLYMEIGRIVAKSIKIDKQVLGIPFCRYLLKRLMGEKPTFLEFLEDIKHDSKNYINKINILLNIDNFFDLNYDEILKETLMQDYGIIIEFNNNCIDIIETPLIDEFVKGFHMILSLNNFNDYGIKSVDDLDILLRGKFNVLNWQEQTKYSYDEDCDQIIEWFWKIVNSLSYDQQKKLLMFQTGCHHIIPSYDKNYEIFINMNKLNKLISTDTCYRRLIISNYENYEIMYKMIIYVIDNVIGFQKD